MDDDFRKAALDYHRLPRPGKLSVEATKRMSSQRDLALAYSPGVAAACDEIVADPANAWLYTARANLVGVISNGTAVLGLGNIGALAGKPVMEGKAVLFKKFAGIDVFDIEVDEQDPARFIEVVAALEPTFGAINLEDIKAPECWEIEAKLRARMKIPVFHDDQHGTAITVAAAVRNALVLQDKQLSEAKLVTSGAGAAAMACVDLLVAMGLKPENVTLTDVKGVVHAGRPDLPPRIAPYVRETDARTLPDVLDGADIFMGLSAPHVLKPEWLGKLAPRPIILALANPEPEIDPDLVRQARPDAIVATGRTDYPNQVNNVLCFPFIFRGALDVGATAITREMELATVRAIAELAQAEQSDIVAMAYGGQNLSFGPEYLIPRPFDPRLIGKIAPAVAQAAMASGVATRPIADFDAYRERLSQFVYHSGLIMKPVFDAAKQAPKRVVYADGEEERVLRAAQVVIDEGIARPILIGRPDVIEMRIERLGLRMKRTQDFELVDPGKDARYREYWTEYLRLAERKGATPEIAKLDMRRLPTLIGAMLIHMGAADAMLTGVLGRYLGHLRFIDQVIGKRAGVNHFAAMNLLLLPRRTVFICDTYVTFDPTAEQIAETTLLAAEEIRRFGITPKVALLSHSSFGASDTPTARKMRAALALIGTLAPTLEVEGEMQGDAALSEEIRMRVFPNSRLRGDANLLIMPTLDTANIAFNLLKTAAGDGITVGPILLGAAKPVHIMTMSATVRRIVNMTALTVVDAINQRGEQKRLL